MTSRNPVYALILVLSVTLAGCGGSSSSGATPAAYVKSICGAVAPFEKDVQARSQALNVASIKNASQGKAALESFLNAIASDTSAAVDKLKTAGVPSIPNGKAISVAIVGAFTQLGAALHSAANQASSLPTSSAASFRTAANALGTSVRSSMQGIGASLGTLKSPTLEKAAKAQPGCASLGA
ncbi:MAG: hypothetical protein ACYC91_02985 [Solirubrobacteraceae bacterium]